MATTDRIDLNACNQSLIGTRFAGKLQHFTSVSSTNTLLLDAAASARSPAPEGTVYIADEQTAGRGRGGHAWHSAPGEGLYVSALVRPALELREALLLSLATGIAAWQAVHEVTGLRLDLRWPNDLMLGGRKLGGILVETAVQHGGEPWIRHAVIGLGINIHHISFSTELQPLATSLALESSTNLDRQPILIAFLRALDRELTELEQAPQHDVSELLKRFAELSSWVHGKRVHVPEQGGYTGRTAGLDERGFLLVDSDDGVRRTVLSGGVREAE